MARSSTSRTPGRLQRRCSCKGPEARTPSTTSTSVITVPPRSQTSTATVQAASVDRLTLIARFLSLAGDLDLVVGGESGKLIYMENTGTSTEPEFAEFAFLDFESSYSYLYDDDYVDDDYVPTMPPSRQSSYPNLFAGIDVGQESIPVLGDIDGDGTLRPRPSIDI